MFNKLSCLLGFFAVQGKSTMLDPENIVLLTDLQSLVNMYPTPEPEHIQSLQDLHTDGREA